MTKFAESLGSPWQKKKNEGPCTCLKYLGLVLNTQEWTVSIPDEKSELLLFGEQAGAYIILVTSRNESSFLKQGAGLKKNKLVKVGQTTKGEQCFFINNKKIKTTNLYHASSSSLEFLR